MENQNHPYADTELVYYNPCLTTPGGSRQNQRIECYDDDYLQQGLECVLPEYSAEFEYVPIASSDPCNVLIIGNQLGSMNGYNQLMHSSESGGSLSPHVPQFGNPSNEILQSQPQDIIVQGTLIGASQQHCLDHNNGDQSTNQAASRKSLRGKVWCLIFFERVKFIQSRKQGMVSIRLPGFDFQIPSNVSFDAAKVEIMKKLEAIVGSLSFYLRIPDKITVESKRATRTDSLPDKQHNLHCQGMVSIRLPGFDIQIPSNLSFDAAKVEIMKKLKAIVGSLRFDLCTPDKITVESKRATRTDSLPDKQHNTGKRKYAQGAVVPHRTKTKVVNVPSLEISNSASSSSPLSSNPQAQKSKKFTEEEIKLLIEGAEKCGAGEWTEIQQDFFTNGPFRTNRQLQDKWKSLVKAASSDPYAKKKKKKEEEIFAGFYRRVRAVEKTRNPEKLMDE